MEASHLNAQLSQFEDMWKTGSIKIWITQNDISPEKELSSIDFDMVGAGCHFCLAGELRSTKPEVKSLSKIPEKIIIFIFLFFGDYNDRIPG